jgi:hypothetical protein
VGVALTTSLGLPIEAEPERVHTPDKLSLWTSFRVCLLRTVPEALGSAILDVVLVAAEANGAGWISARACTFSKNRARLTPVDG